MGPRSGLRSSKRKDSPSLLGAVDLGECLAVAAKALRDAGAQGASGEGLGVVGAEVGALLLEREDARSLPGAVDLGERLAIAAKGSEGLRAVPASEEGLGWFGPRSGSAPREERMPRRSSVPSISASAWP